MTRLALPHASWPVADRELLEVLFQCGSLLDEAGPLSRLKPISRRNLVTAYGRWLGWLTQEEPVALLEPPVERATPNRFRNWLASVGHLTPRSQHTLGSLTLWMLKLAAPDAD